MKGICTFDAIAAAIADGDHARWAFADQATDKTVLTLSVLDTLGASPCQTLPLTPATIAERILEAYRVSPRPAAGTAEGAGPAGTRTLHLLGDEAVRALFFALISVMRGQRHFIEVDLTGGSARYSVTAKGDAIVTSASWHETPPPLTLAAGDVLIFDVVYQDVKFPGPDYKEFKHADLWAQQPRWATFLGLNFHNAADKIATEVAADDTDPSRMQTALRRAYAVFFAAIRAELRSATRRGHRYWLAMTPSYDGVPEEERAEIAYRNRELKAAVAAHATGNIVDPAAAAAHVHHPIVIPGQLGVPLLAEASPAISRDVLVFDAAKLYRSMSDVLPGPRKASLKSFGCTLRIEVRPGDNAHFAMNLDRTDGIECKGLFEKAQLTLLLHSLR